VQVPGAAAMQQQAAPAPGAAGAPATPAAAGMPSSAAAAPGLGQGAAVAGASPAAGAAGAVPGPVANGNAYPAVTGTAGAALASTQQTYQQQQQQPAQPTPGQARQLPQVRCPCLGHTEHPLFDLCAPTQLCVMLWCRAHALQALCNSGMPGPDTPVS
jgi:hypothetical protein